MGRVMTTGFPAAVKSALGTELAFEARRRLATMAEWDALDVNGYRLCAPELPKAAGRPQKNRLRQK
jgi:hypothetical protein